MFSQILNLGITDKLPLTQRKYIQVTNVICLFAAIMTLGYFPPAVATGNTFILIYYSVLPVIYLSFLWLNWKGFFRIVRHGIAIVTIIFVFSMLPLFGEQLMGYIWFFPLTSALPIVFTRKENLALIIYEIISIALFVFSYLYSHEVTPFYTFHTEFDKIVALTAPLFSLLITFSFVWFYRRTMIKGDKMFEDAYIKAENLLLNILPVKIANRLKKGEDNIADHHPNVSVMFIDVVGFNKLTAIKKPEEIVYMLNSIFSLFDRLSTKHNVEKIKTIGDSYLVVSGLPEANVNHAHELAKLALDIISWLENSDIKQQGIDFRIGINSGPVVAGIIGIRKFIYDLWGDTVNLASRMRTQGEVNRIQISEQTYILLKDNFDTIYRGLIEIKGKGQQKTWWLVSEKIEFDFHKRK